jgi:hypothetical protein
MTLGVEERKKEEGKKERQKEGKKEEGSKERRKEGRKEGKKDRRKEGKTERQKDGVSSYCARLQERARLPHTRHNQQQHAPFSTP